jgi:uncharacterized protein YaiL (DUF2058 family)
MLSERFGIPISDNGTIPEATRQKAQQAELERQRQLLRQGQIKAKSKELSAYIQAYEQLLRTAEPFSDDVEYYSMELVKCIGKWEWLFSELRKS